MTGMTQPHYIDREAVLTALRLADDVLSRSPNSTRIWITDTGEVHPAKGISLIRRAIEIMSAPMEAVAWREKVAALIEDNVEAERRGPGEGWLEVVGIYDAADAILQALAVIPTQGGEGT